MTDQPKRTRKNGLIAALVLIGATVGGLAAFRENVTKLFAGFERPHIVLKAEGSMSVFNFAPTDTNYHVQQITFHYPSTLSFDPSKFLSGPDPTSNTAVRFDALLQRLGPLVLAEKQLRYPDTWDGVRCEMEFPVVIESDFIDQRSTRYSNDSLYYVDITFDHQVAPFPFMKIIKFDHDIGFFEDREKLLELAFAKQKPSCYTVPIVPQAFRQH